MLLLIERETAHAGPSAPWPRTRSRPQPADSPFAVLEPMYRRHRIELLRFLTRRAGTEAAPDLLHEVFLRAAASPQVWHLTNPLGFLYRIAHNLLIDRARRRRSQLEHLALGDARDAVSPPQQDHAISAGDVRAVIAATLERLPPRTRQVFGMQRMGGLSYREIRAALGLSQGAVEYHMMRALDHLRLAAQAADLVDWPATRPGNRACSKNNFK